VVDEELTGLCCKAGLNDPYHPSRVLPVVAASCAPLEAFVGNWQEIETSDSERRRAYRGADLIGGVLPEQFQRRWCADSQVLYLLLAIHDLRVIDAAYRLQGMF